MSETPRPAARGDSSEETPADDGRWRAAMEMALAQARGAAIADEVPVGAVVLRGDEVLALAHNRREADDDPTAHAEMVAIREAARKVGSWRLDGCTMVVTLEPCFMCAGALVNARVERLVYGAADPKGGAAGTLADVVRDPRLNHRMEVVTGVLADRCADVLRRFFALKRGTRAGGGEIAGEGA